MRILQIKTSQEFKAYRNIELSTLPIPMIVAGKGIGLQQLFYI